MAPPTRMTRLLIGGRPRLVGVEFSKGDLNRNVSGILA